MPTPTRLQQLGWLLLLSVLALWALARLTGLA